MNRFILHFIIFFIIIISINLAVAENNPAIGNKNIAAAEQLIGLEFTASEQDMMKNGLNEQIKSYKNIRSVALKNSDPSPFFFDPTPSGFKFETKYRPFIFSPISMLAVPHDLNDLAYATVSELGELIRTKRISSEALTKMYIERIKKYNPKLLAVITLTEELAIKEAKKADAEIAAGKYRGPLHGIPFGVKDILAVKNYPTTWGAVPYKNQKFNYDATVVKKLKEAGAILIAKTSVGELAMDDVWFGGQTKNPWNIQQGSSGSSAGSASGVSAALFPFAIGSETEGSIIAPATVCGVTGLRPSFGRVSRYGAMALSWSMDKIGVLCRSIEDCALIFNIIRGSDGLDRTVRDLPFNYNPNVNFKHLRIGYMQEDFNEEKNIANKKADAATLQKLKEMGATLIPIRTPKYPIADLATIIMSAESSAAFDHLTRTHQDDQLAQQGEDRWPNVFRMSRFIPAVEYLQACRIRNIMIQDFAKTMDNIDIYVAPSLEGDNSYFTNLIGYPSVVVPNGFDDKKGHPTSITFIGKLNGEALLLGVAKAYQDATLFHKQRPF